jgi:hypothetical protein
MSKIENDIAELHRGQTSILTTLEQIASRLQSPLIMPVAELPQMDSMSAVPMVTPTSVENFHDGYHNPHRQIDTAFIDSPTQEGCKDAYESK